MILFKSIFIFDTINERACFHEFKKGLNVITSSQNHVGKSSLIKSLYYALGAEVNFDKDWNKQNKIVLLKFSVDEIYYSICRLNSKYIIFNNKNDIIKMTNKDSKELSKALSDIFKLTIFLPNKLDDKIERTPPVFMYLPYYIDQDTGWSDSFNNSFSSLLQFRKEDRMNSLYYHIGLYSKDTINKKQNIDNLESEIKKVNDDLLKNRNVYEKLDKEIKNNKFVKSSEELEFSINIFKEKIKSKLTEASKIRSEINKIESEILDYKNREKTIIDYQKLMKQEEKKTIKTDYQCPKCGHITDNSLNDLIRSNYGKSSTDFFLSEIEYLKNIAKEKLDIEMKKYLELVQKINEEEKNLTERDKAFNDYIKYQGLRDTIVSIQKEISSCELEVSALNSKKNLLKSEEKKLNKKRKEIEEFYKNNVQANLMKLSAWSPEYEQDISITKPLFRQGSLNNKIVLSNHFALFSTIDKFNPTISKFPFVLDSPRTHETSEDSSIEIIEMILQLNNLPQTILATIDYSRFKEKINILHEGNQNDDENIIFLNTPKMLLKPEVYEVNKKLVETLKNIFAMFN